MLSIHPLADEWDEDYLLLVSNSERVLLTAGIRGFLLDARESRLKPVLLTSTTAHLSWFVADELRLAGGYWAVKDDRNRVFDGRTGARLKSIRGLWDPTQCWDEGLGTFDAYTPDAKGAFFLDVFTREQATERTRAGLVAERMVAGLGGGRLVRWDTCEPLAQPWSPGAITERMRLQMPASERFFGRAPGGACVNLTMSRTRSGLLEHTRGLIPVGDYHHPIGLPQRAPLGAHPAVAETLTGLAERARVNVAMISYCEVVERQGSLGQLAGLRRPDSPVAVLIGPVAAKTLGINVPKLAEQYDITTVGLTRAPSVLVRFSGFDSLWTQFVDFGRELDEERLAALLAHQLDSPLFEERA